MQLQNQTDVDNFRQDFPNCTQIEGNLSLWNFDFNDPILNLDSLRGIKSVGGFLEIIDCYELTDISGLAYLDSIGKFFRISKASSLTELTGVDSLKTIGGFLDISENALLDNLDGLSNLENIGNYFTLSSNPKLTNIEGLVNLKTVMGPLVISSNSILESLTGIDNIDPGSFNNLIIDSNPLLFECEVLSVCEYLEIEGALYSISSNADGCDSYQQVRDACFVSVDDNNGSIATSIFPNPASGRVTIATQNTSEIEEAFIINQVGQKVKVPFSGKTFDVSGLSSGVYYVTINLSGRNIIHKLLLRN